MVRIFRAGRRNRGVTPVAHAYVEPSEDVVSVQVSRIPPPANPIELGLTLRTARERAGLSLEQVRDQIEIPLVDLNAIERGSLELLHLEQAAVVAIWRYADLLSLDPDVLVGVVRTFWPNQALGIDAFRSPAGSTTPMSHLAAARQLLGPIAEPRALSAPGATIGLSRETLDTLAHAIGKSSLGLELGGPPMWSTPALGTGAEVASTSANWDEEPLYSSFEGEVATESYATLGEVPLASDEEYDEVVEIRAPDTEYATDYEHAEVPETDEQGGEPRTVGKEYRFTE